MTHTSARTMAYMRKLGYKVGDTQKPWNPYTRKRTDLFGIFDCLAYKGDETIGVQACGTDFSAHEKKIRSSEFFHSWLEGGTRFILLVGWSKRVVRNKDGTKSKVKRWTPRLLYITP